MIINDSIRDKVGATVYDTWKDAALADLTAILCMDTFNQSQSDMTGFVSQDGKHVYLPSWYSEIWSVKTIDGTALNYKVNYYKDDGLTPATQYTNVVDLTGKYPAGMKVAVNGRHGFKKLPAPLASILTAIIQADQSIADRTDSITSKRIEDVSVSYATNGQYTIERALTPYKALISSWSICQIRTDTGGLLDMPTPNHDLPWWINTQDYQGGDYTYGTAM